MMEHKEYVPAWGVQNFQQPKYKTKWVPLAGKKRKTPDEPNSCLDFDTEAPPAKQLAIDDEIAPNIIKDGYIIPDSDASNDGFAAAQNTVVQLDDVEMEDSFEEEAEEEDFDSTYAGSNTSLIRDNNKNNLFGGGDSEHAFDGLSSSVSNGNVQIGSVLLSEEVRASLARKQNDVSTFLPQSLVNQMYKNATAVVLWQPRVKPLSSPSEPLQTYSSSSSAKKEQKRVEKTIADEEEESILLTTEVDKSEMEVEIISNIPTT